MSKTRFYGIYSWMWNRCNNAKTISYPNYWAKGIKVEWGSFDEFKRDMYDTYLQLSEQITEKFVSIDRKNPKANYSKENCTWVHLYEQPKNKRIPMKRLSYNWKNKTITEWAEELGFKRDTILGRIKYWWSNEKILSTPLIQSIPRIWPRKRYPPKAPRRSIRWSDTVFSW